MICFSLNNVVYLKSAHVDEPNCPSFTFTTVHNIIVKLNIFESPFPGKKRKEKKKSKLKNNYMANYFLNMMSKP